MISKNEGATWKAFFQHKMHNIRRKYSDGYHGSRERGQGEFIEVGAWASRVDLVVAVVAGTTERLELPM